MALTTEYIQSLEGLAPELRAVLVALLGEIQGGETTVADGSVTHAKLAANAVEEDNIKDGAVTADKMASGVIPNAYTLPAATTSALGGVKQAAAVSDPASDEAAAVGTSLKALTSSLRAAGILQSS